MSLRTLLSGTVYILVFALGFLGLSWGIVSPLMLLGCIVGTIVLYGVFLRGAARLGAAYENKPKPAGFLAGFGVESPTSAAAGALAAVAMGASIYAYFIEEQIRRAAVTFEVTCSSTPNLNGTVELLNVTKEPIRNCSLTLEPTFVIGEQPVDPSTLPKGANNPVPIDDCGLKDPPQKRPLNALLEYAIGPDDFQKIKLNPSIRVDSLRIQMKWEMLSGRAVPGDKKDIACRIPER